MAGAKSLRWEIPSAGSINSLRLKEETVIDVGDLGSGQILVKVKAVGLNFADIFACQGLYSATPQGAFTPGLEFSGEVLGVGTEAKWKAGSKVMGVTRFGGYTTHLVVDQRFVQPLPDGWSYEEGAGFLCTGMTAWYGLVELGGLKKSQTVLVHSAAGGVGQACLEIVAAYGSQSICTIGNPSKASMLQERFKIPADAIIVRARTSKEFGVQLQGSMDSLGCQEGLDIVMDAVQGPYFQPAYDKLNRGGRLIVFGAASMTPSGASPNWFKLAWQWLFRPMVDPLAIIAANKSVMGFNLIWMWDKVDEMTGMLSQMMEKVPWRAPVVGRSFKFEQAKEALAYLQSGQSIGKVVLVTE